MFLSTFSVSRPAVWRVLSATAVSAALLTLAVGSTSAAPAAPQPAGTVVGSVTCGPTDQSPATSALVQVAGADVSTRAAGDGKFILDNVPAGQVLTVTALSDPLGSDVSSRPDVSLQAGETLDIGNLDLSACPSPIPAAVAADQNSDDSNSQP
jgi:hypothetical protein